MVVLQSKSRTCIARTAFVSNLALFSLSEQTPPAGDTGLSYLEMAAKNKDKPFFIGVAPIGPHDETVINLQTNLPEFLPPVPAKRHAGLFNDTKVPSTASFNPNSPSSVSWIRNLPQLNASQVEYIDEWYRLRLRSLQAVNMHLLMRQK